MFSYLPLFRRGPGVVIDVSILSSIHPDPVLDCIPRAPSRGLYRLSAGVLTPGLLAARSWRCIQQYALVRFRFRQLLFGNFYSVSYSCPPSCYCLRLIGMDLIHRPARVDRFRRGYSWHITFPCITYPSGMFAAFAAHFMASFHPGLARISL